MRFEFVGCARIHKNSFRALYFFFLAVGSALFSCWRSNRCVRNRILTVSILEYEIFRWRVADAVRYSIVRWIVHARAGVHHHISSPYTESLIRSRMLSCARVLHSSFVQRNQANVSCKRRNNPFSGATPLSKPKFIQNRLAYERMEGRTGR